MDVFTQGGLLFLSFLFAATGCAIWFYSPRSLRHGFAFVFGLSCAHWAFSLYMVVAAHSPPQALFWTRVAFWGPPITCLTYILILRDVSRSEGESFLTPALWFPIVLCSAVLFGAFHPEVIRSVRPGLGAAPSFEYGRFYGLEMLGASILGILCLVQAWRVTVTTKGRERAQAEIMLIGMVVSGVLGAIPNLILPLLGDSSRYQLGPFAYLPGLAATYYAVAFHRLFDIEIAIGPWIRTNRYELHTRVQEAITRPENYLSLPALSTALQKAFDAEELNITLLDEESRPKKVYGNTTLAFPGRTLLTQLNGRVLTAREVPAGLRREMQEKRICAVVRIGDVRRPLAVMTLGERFGVILFSTQDFTLLAFLARQLELMIQVAVAQIQTTPDPAPSPAPERESGSVETGLFEFKARPKRILLFDPDGTFVSRIQNALPGLEIHSVAAVAQLLSRSVRETFDLAVAPPAVSVSGLKDILGRFSSQSPNLPIVLFRNAGQRAEYEQLEPLPDQVAAVLPVGEGGAADIARILQTAIAAGRYYRGEFDLSLLEGNPEARKNLFPLLALSLSEAKDFMGMTRLFQRRLIRYTLDRSVSQADAARKLGLTPPNFSLKLKYLGMRSIPPAS